MTVSLSHIKNRICGLLSQQISNADMTLLLRELIDAGGGLTIELDDARYRGVLRDGKFALKVVDRKRPSTIPPFR